MLEPLMGVAPYPYERWPRVSRDDARVTRLAARAVGPAAVARAAVEVARVFGGRAEVALSRIDRLPSGTVGLDRDAIAFVLAQEPARKDDAVVVSLDAVLAAGLVDVVLGGDGSGIGLAPGTVPSEIEAGILAYAVERLVASLDEIGRRVVAVLRTPGAVDEVLGGVPCVAFVLRAHIGALPEGIVRLVVREASLAHADPAGGAPSWIDAVPLVLVADVARGALPRSELEHLELGDVVVLDEIRGDTVRGTIFGAARTVVDLARETGGLRVSRIATTSLQAPPAVPASSGGMMDTTEEATRVDGVTRAADAPIEVAAELARFRLTVGELGALRVGDVFRTGAAVGERVRLRAGDTIVAEGELVDVEGELGVRIVRVAK